MTTVHAVRDQLIQMRDLRFHYRDWGDSTRAQPHRHRLITDHGAPAEDDPWRP